MEFLTAAYPWLKWLHLLALISWMVGLFYLPRLFVYHAESSEAAVHATLETMEYKLMKVIMTPAMLVTWVSGILLIASIGASGGWIWIKIAIVFGLTGFHGVCGKWRKELAAGTSTRTGRFFRMMNEVPTVALIAIVGLVIFKPFS
jgi:putative membrane protein